MIIYIILLGLSILGFFYVRSGITRSHIEARQTIRQQHAALVQEYEKLCAQKKQLAAESLALHNQINRLSSCNKDSTCRVQAAIQKTPQKPMKSDEIASHLIKNGLITLEQHQKALTAMQTMKLDLISTCLTLGFIEENIATEVSESFRSS